MSRNGRVLAMAAVKFDEALNVPRALGAPLLTCCIHTEAELEVATMLSA